MGLRLHNTLSKRVEEFAPREAGKVSMYVCGPTVYDSSHLGHMRAAVVFDVPEATCRLWDARRERKVGTAVIRRQWEMLQDALRRIPGEGYEQTVILSEADVAKTRVEVA